MKRLRFASQLATLAALAAIILTQACGQSSGTYHTWEPLPAQEVPQGLAGQQLHLPAFPSDREASANVPFTQDAADAIDVSASAQVDGTELRLPGGTGTLQYGLYRWAAGTDPTISLAVKKETPAGQYYVGVADYASERWKISGPFGAISNTLDLSAGDFVSPAGNVHCFVGVFSGTTATLQTLTLTLDSNVPTFTVSGRVTEGVAGVAGVTMSLGGDGAGSTQTDNQGNYSFTGLVDGSYTVTPALTGYTFNPPTGNANVTGADVDLDFAATAVAGTFTISGTITDAASIGINGVTVNLTGDDTMSVTTNITGAYSFTNVPDGNYTVTPTLATWTFNPVSTAVTVSGANQTGKDFEGSQAAAVTYETGAGVIRSMVMARCSPCHTSGNPDGNVRFDSWAEVDKDSPSLPGQKVYQRMYQRGFVQANMPPGSMPQSERNKLEAWMNGGYQR